MTYAGWLLNMRRRAWCLASVVILLGGSLFAPGIAAHTKLEAEDHSVTTDSFVSMVVTEGVAEEVGDCKVRIDSAAQSFGNGTVTYDYLLIDTSGSYEGPDSRSADDTTHIEWEFGTTKHVTRDAKTQNREISEDSTHAVAHVEMECGFGGVQLLDCTQDCQIQSYDPLLSEPPSARVPP